MSIHNGDQPSTSQTVEMNDIYYGNTTNVSMQNQQGIARFLYQYVCPFTNTIGEMEQEMVMGFDEPILPLSTWLMKFIDDNC